MTLPEALRPALRRHLALIAAALIAAALLVYLLGLFVPVAIPEPAAPPRLTDSKPLQEAKAQRERSEAAAAGQTQKAGEKRREAAHQVDAIRKAQDTPLNKLVEDWNANL